jgi:hypothetical protein
MLTQILEDIRDIYRRVSRRVSLFLKRRAEVGPRHTPKIERKVSLPLTERRIQASRMQ